jgi:hypothetical protein
VWPAALAIKDKYILWSKSSSKIAKFIDRLL